MCNTFLTTIYCSEGIAKVFVLLYKKDVFSSLIEELATIWPVPPLDNDAQAIKDKSLAALRIAHQCKYKIVVLHTT